MSKYCTNLLLFLVFYIKTFHGFCLQAGSINYHRIIVSKFYAIRFVTFWILFGSKYKFAQSCSPLHSFTHLHFDLKNKSKI